VLRARLGTVEPLGWDAPNLVGEYASDLFVADDALSARALLHRAAHRRACPPLTLRIHGAGDTEIVARVSARAAEHGISIQIRECDEAETDAFRAAAPERARFDPLTGLPNRLLMLEWARTAPRTTTQALVLIDLDRFRDLATAFGNRVCDNLLVEIADRLVAAIADSGDVGLSGHQFTILVPAHSLPGSIGNLVTQIRAVIGEPIPACSGAIELSGARALGFRVTKATQMPERSRAASRRAGGKRPARLLARADRRLQAVATMAGMLRARKPQSQNDLCLMDPRAPGCSWSRRPGARSNILETDRALLTIHVMTRIFST